MEKMSLLIKSIHSIMSVTYIRIRGEEMSIVGSG